MWPTNWASLLDQGWRRRLLFRRCLSLALIRLLLLLFLCIRGYQLIILECPCCHLNRAHPLRPNQSIIYKLLSTGGSRSTKSASSMMMISIIFGKSIFATQIEIDRRDVTWPCRYRVHVLIIIWMIMRSGWRGQLIKCLTFRSWLDCELSLAKWPKEGLILETRAYSDYFRREL